MLDPLDLRITISFLILLSQRNERRISFGLYTFFLDLFEKDTMEQAEAAISLLELEFPSIIRRLGALQIMGEWIVGVGKCGMRYDSKTGNGLDSSCSISQSCVKVCCWLWISSLAGVSIAELNSCVNWVGYVTIGISEGFWFASWTRGFESTFGVIGGEGSDDMVLNSLVDMVGVWCLPFFHLRRCLGIFW